MRHTTDIQEKTTHQEPPQRHIRIEPSHLTDPIPKDDNSTGISRVYNRPHEPMGQRDTCTCSSSERIQSPSYQQTEIYNRKEHTQGSQQEHYRHTEQSKKSVREIDSIYQTRPSKESHDSSTIEGTPPNHTCRCHGNGHGNQRRGTSNNMERSHSINSSNYVDQDTVGRVSITAIHRSGNTGQVRNPAFHPPTSQMLQMSKIQPYLQHLPRKKRHLRPLRRSSQNKDMCRQAELTSGSEIKMQQLQRGALHSKRKMSLSQGDHKPKEASTTSSGTIIPTEAASQVGLVHHTTAFETLNTHDTQTSTKQVPPTAIHTCNGRLPRYTTSYRQQDNHNQDSNKASTSTTHPGHTHTETPNSAEENTTFRGLETSCKEPRKAPTTNSPHIIYQEPSRTKTYTTTRSNTSNTHAHGNRDTTAYNQQDNQTRVPDVSKRHSIHKSTHHEHATAPNGPDGRNNTKSVHRQYNESNITEHARHHSEIRIMHWNAQGLNNPGKQSALVAAIQLDHIDITMIQDSRLATRDDGKPPIRVPNCHTYFIPTSAECHGLLTIVRNTIPSKPSPLLVTSEGTEVLTVKVWINKKATLLHNIYRVRGQIAFTEILADRLPSILAMWCRSTNGSGRTLLEQIENAHTHTIMNNPQTSTTIYNTTIDLTIVHASIAATCQWEIYDSLLSDHYPILLTIRTKESQPVTVPIPRWCLHKADWEKFKTRLNELSTTYNMDGTLEEQEKKLTEMLIQSAEDSIPKTKPQKNKRKYWCYNEEVKIAKWYLNRALKKLRSKKRCGLQDLEPYKQKVRDANQNYNETCTKIRNKAWNEWLTKANTDVNSKTIWQKIKRCTGTNQHPPIHPNPVQESNRLLSEFVTRSSSVQLPEEDIRTLQQYQPERQRQLQEAINRPSDCDRPITITEINNVLKKVRDSSPGEDTIAYSMLKNAPTSYIQHLANLYTRSLQEGKLPPRWKMATIIPIPKNNKTYRPISLLSVLGKIMEKIILHRIRWAANSPHVRATGFKPGSGTRDAISILLHDISTSRTRKRRAAAIYLDLQKAFELVNKDVLLSELITSGLHGRLLAWTSDFLSDRCAKVRFQNCLSETQSFDNGTPQGSSLSPTLFNYAMNIFLRLQLPEGVRILAYADDLVLYCVDRQNIIQRLQSALDIMTTEASNHGFRFAPEKTIATWFFHANPDIKLKLYNQDISWADRAKYLGVSIDKQLNMHSQVNHTLNNVSRALNTIKVMSSLSGVNSKILLRTYNGCMRACLDYGAECFNMLTQTQMRRLQRKQNTGLKLVLGINKWAPTTNVHAELRILPLALRVEIFQTNMINKFLLNQNHPLHNHIRDELNCPRIRNAKHKHTWLNTICRSHRKLAPFIPGVENVEVIKPWSASPLQIVINDHLPPKQTTDSSVLYNMTMATMADISQPQDHLYFTDGSVSEGRVSAAFTYLGQPTLIRLCDNASIMQAELTAIHAALLHGLPSPSRCVIFSDSRSGLEALLQHQPKYNIKLLRDIWDIAASMTTPPLIAWIPSHIGIAGNETADRATYPPPTSCFINPIG